MMMTVRQIERRWTSGSFGRLADELLACRFEDSPMLRNICRQSSAATAAIGMIRLDELNQSQSALHGQLLRHVLSEQQADGGWEDPVTTALALKALLNHEGSGAAIESGIDHLAGLQRDDGGWPAVAMRRLPSDTFVTAFILYTLGDFAQFAQAVRFHEAMAFLDAHAAGDLSAQRLHVWRGSLQIPAYDGTN